jgi:UDP-N-acetyl-D-glucosamine dehydrogenase
MGLREKILDRSAKVGVVGLGYVGLPLAVEFGRAGFQVHGIDVDRSRIENIRTGNSYIQDVPGTALVIDCRNAIRRKAPNVVRL